MSWKPRLLAPIAGTFLGSLLALGVWWAFLNTIRHDCSRFFRGIWLGLIAQAEVAAIVACIGGVFGLAVGILAAIIGLDKGDGAGRLSISRLQASPGVFRGRDRSITRTVIGNCVRSTRCRPGNGSTGCFAAAYPLPCRCPLEVDLKLAFHASHVYTEIVHWR